MLPSISIVCAVYNRERYIATCLDCLLDQSFPAELVVIDGGSTDGSINVINRYLNKISYFISEKDLGIYDALNKGVNNSTGDIVGILHSDDIFTNKDVLLEVSNFFKKNPTIDILIGNAILVSTINSAKVLRNFRSTRFKLFSMRFGFMPCHTATFIRRKVFNKIGFYDEKFISAGDFDFFLRALFISKTKYFLLNKTLVVMSVGGMSTSGFKSYIRSTREILISLKKNKIYSNIILVLLRLPIKLITHFYDTLITK
jgi:glycosyltransferase involved in cell wall biosynthesis